MSGPALHGLRAGPPVAVPVEIAHVRQVAHIERDDPYAWTLLGGTSRREDPLTGHGPGEAGAARTLQVVS